MSWLSDAWDSVSGFVSDNKDVVGGLLDTGISAFGQYNKDQSQSDYLNYLRERENQNYQNSLDSINYYNAQGAAAAGDKNAMAAAMAAAMKAQEAARMAAAKKANRRLQKTYKEILKMYKPFRDTAMELLPLKTNAYKDSLGLQGNLLSFVNSPEQTAKLNASVPSWQVNVPLPDYVRLK